MCLAILIPMLFFQYGVADVLPDDFGMDNSAACSNARAFDHFAVKWLGF